MDLLEDWISVGMISRSVEYRGYAVAVGGKADGPQVSIKLGLRQGLLSAQTPSAAGLRPARHAWRLSVPWPRRGLAADGRERDGRRRSLEPL